MLIVDAYTKWLDVHVTSSSTAAITIEKLQRTFATFDLPKTAKFLIKYQATPHSTTGVSSAELMFNRRLRTHLDLLPPSIGQTVRQNQSKQKMYHDTHSRARDFKEGNTVYVHSLDGINKWLLGIITTKQGPLLFRVQYRSIITSFLHTCPRVAPR